MAGRASTFKFDPEWRITLFALVMVPLMTGLGFWQLQREGQKVALAAVFEARQTQAPVPLAEIWDEADASLAYRPVRLAGEFAPDAYFLLDNRVRGGRFGYEVIGLLQLADGERTVLVNRGWIAGDAARRSLPEVPPVDGAVVFEGYIHVAPGTPYMLAEQTLAAGWPKLIQAVEMHKLIPAVETLRGGEVFPYPVRINPGESGALVAEWQVVNVSPEKHRGYAIQWFAMAAVLTLFYFLRCSNLWQLLTRSPE